jgi:tripartite-type tricarboxylate transporter receptor subunit TctC
MSKKKMLGRVGFMTLSLSIALSFLWVFVAVGQEYPTRPIKLIVPFSPGGVADLTWRSMTDPMSKVLGQPVVIENKPGGGGSLGYTMVASAKSDGYTVGHVPLGSFINNYLMYDVSYNPTKDFTFIGGVARYAESIVVRSDSPWKTWDEFVDYSKKHPNEVRIGFSGAASSNTIATKWIEKQLELKWRQVTFPGDAEGITALLGGHIDAFPGAGPQNILVKDGRARMLLALTVDPIPGFPNVPTFKKLFGKETMNASGLMGPAGIPAPVLDKLEKAVQEGTKDPGFLKTMEQMNMTPLWRNSKEFAQDVNNALKSFQEFLKELNMLKKK